MKNNYTKKKGAKVTVLLCINQKKKTKNKKQQNMAKSGLTKVN